MKKKLAVMISLFMILALSACGKSQDAAPADVGSSADTTNADTNRTVATDTITAETSIPETDISENGTSETAISETSILETVSAEGSDEIAKAASHILVVYFSATGTTKEIAEKLADGMDADIYEIVPEIPYTDVDLDYHDNKNRSTIEMNDASARPAISGLIESIEQYDTIFVGYPIWWGEAPRIMCTFVESLDFSGKTIVPFCTSARSGVGSSATNLEKLTSGANWLAGKRFSGSESADTVMDWVNGLNLSN